MESVKPQFPCISRIAGSCILRIAGVLFLVFGVAFVGQYHMTWSYETIFNDEIVSTENIEAANERPRVGPKFVYLLTLARGPIPTAYGDYHLIPGDESELIVLTFREPLKGAVFSPGGTFGSHRNQLLREVLRRERCLGWAPVYYIFIDDHAKKPFVLRNGKPSEKNGNVYREFEENLSLREPAVGLPLYAWWHWRVPTLMNNTNLAHNFDHILVAYHRDAARILLPYFDTLDLNCAFLNQQFISVLATSIYHHWRMIFRSVILQGKVPKNTTSSGTNKCGCKYGQNMDIVKKGFLPSSPFQLPRVGQRQNNPFGCDRSSDINETSCQPLARSDFAADIPYLTSGNYDFGRHLHRFVNMSNAWWATNRRFWSENDPQRECTGGLCACSHSLSNAPCDPPRPVIPCGFNSELLAKACNGSIGCPSACPPTYNTTGTRRRLQE